MKKIIGIVVLFVAVLSCSKEEALNDPNNPSPATISANQKGLGTSARDLLSEATFKSMVVEIVFVEGFEPSSTSINNLVSFIEARTYKPNGVSVVKRSIPSTGKATYTNAEIIAIEEANRTKYNTSNQIAVWAFFADGESASNTNSGVVLGTAYRNTSFVIYAKTIQGMSSSPFQPSRSLLETTVITHEFGHLLGLTNLGTALQSDHEDSAHAKHCEVETCLMYWASESGNGIGNMISGGAAPKLDAQCIADLQANGGK